MLGRHSNLQILWRHPLCLQTIFIYRYYGDILYGWDTVEMSSVPGRHLIHRYNEDVLSAWKPLLSVDTMETSYIDAWKPFLSIDTVKTSFVSGSHSYLQILQRHPIQMPGSRSYLQITWRRPLCLEAFLIYSYYGAWKPFLSIDTMETSFMAGSHSCLQIPYSYLPYDLQVIQPEVLYIVQLSSGIRTCVRKARVDACF